MPTITVVIPYWITEVQRSCEQDPELQPIIQAKTIQPDAHPDYTLQAGVFKKKDKKICICAQTDLRQKIVQVLQDSSLGAHLGINGLKENTSAILVCCNQRNLPDQAWACKTMDFIEGLPKSEGKDSILVVIDQFTKYGNSIALSRPSLAKTVAKWSTWLSLAEHWNSTNFHTGLKYIPFQALYGEMMEVFKSNLQKAQNEIGLKGFFKLVTIKKIGHWHNSPTLPVYNDYGLRKFYPAAILATRFIPTTKKLFLNSSSSGKVFTYRGNLRRLLQYRSSVPDFLPSP
ncbi:UNVERIFIED_CONTAM: hypothetical protein Sangu_2611300 [Sesamum angustifolium]|uniref:Uncharacterized protein n=1 Tax=Sesamum angustifolium TaxID=2727405 RepID=A0AAW2J4P9_9LAMI